MYSSVVKYWCTHTVVLNDLCWFLPSVRNTSILTLLSEPYFSFKFGQASCGPRTASHTGVHCLAFFFFGSDRKMTYLVLICLPVFISDSPRDYWSFSPVPSSSHGWCGVNVDHVGKGGKKMRVERGSSGCVFLTLHLALPLALTRTLLPAMSGHVA